MFRITLPMVKPAILSTILLVFGSAMGSYPVPHYLGLTTLSTKYISMNSKYTGEASILAIIMMIFGVAILLMNQMSLKSRKNYTTVTGKSGQISKINLGKVGKYLIAVILIVITFFTSISRSCSFALETFLPNPGDYSFLYTMDSGALTTKWWLTDNNGAGALYGQPGILHNPLIWRAFKGTMLVAVCCALIAGTIGTLIGYAVSKNRRSKWANYVNGVAFLPYLMPSLAVGAAFFILFSNDKINLFNTYTLVDHRRRDQVHSFRQQKCTELHAAAVGRDRGSGHHPGYSLVQADAADHHSNPEVFHYQRIYASVHDLSARAVPVFTVMYAGLYSLHDTGLFR